MLYKDFKGLAISSLGMGCMRLPVNNENKIDYQKAEEIIDYAYNNGINYFDTAYPYHGGESEIFIGKVLKKYPRDSFYLASKFPIWEVKTKEDIEIIFEKQLSKCDVKYFDFYLCHAMSYDRHLEYIKLGVYEFLEKKQKEGKIKFLGFSFHDNVKALKEIVNYRKWDFAQIQFNYLDVSLQNAYELYEILNEKHIKTIVMEPVRGGMLANLSAESTKLLKDKRPNSSIASWALRYVISHENVFVTLSGMSNLEQVIDNVNTVTNFEYLTEEENNLLSEVRKQILGKNYIPCTSCRYCNECPKSIEIPEIFHLFNDFQLHKNDKTFKERYENIKQKADLCIKCGICMKHCPQFIKIPDKLQEIKEYIAKC